MKWAGASHSFSTVRPKTSFGKKTINETFGVWLFLGLLSDRHRLLLSQSSMVYSIHWLKIHLDIWIELSFSYTQLLKLLMPKTCRLGNVLKMYLHQRKTKTGWPRIHRCLMSYTCEVLDISLDNFFVWSKCLKDFETANYTNGFWLTVQNKTKWTFCGWLIIVIPSRFDRLII